MIIKLKVAVKPFRRVLKARLRSGQASLLFLSNKGRLNSWWLGVRLNDTIHRLPGVYLTKSTAILAGLRKYKVKAFCQSAAEAA